MIAEQMNSHPPSEKDSHSRGKKQNPPSEKDSHSRDKKQNPTALEKKKGRVVESAAQKRHSVTAEQKQAGTG